MGKNNFRNAVVHLGNCYVVHYNPYPLQKYNFYINVEHAGFIGPVKSLFKYVRKGFYCMNLLIRQQFIHKEPFTQTTDMLLPQKSTGIFQVFHLEHIPQISITNPHLSNSFLRSREDIEQVYQNDINSQKHVATFFELNHGNSKARRYHYIDFPR